ncbi:MAG: hypothetical protein ACD_5C00293G0002 [uncultured bacterium]|nr:MAG: hypothetical protein ACD_5C00293G0002 [uncultured bacterium]
MNKPNPIVVQKSLEGQYYPASKNDLIETAQNNDADQEIFNILENLPEKDYNSPTEISEEIGKMK